MLSTDELSLQEELERTRAELYEERRRFSDACTIIGEQAEKIFNLNNKVRALESRSEA